jgi:hypothetical protein
MTRVRSLGMVLHPRREASHPVEAITSWADTHDVTVFGLEAEISRLNCQAIAVPEHEIGARADLLVALGGDGTVLRGMLVPGDTIVVAARADAARVVRLGGTTFYERARRKLGIKGSTELIRPGLSDLVVEKRAETGG